MHPLLCQFQPKPKHKKERMNVVTTHDQGWEPQIANSQTSFFTNFGDKLSSIPSFLFSWAPPPLNPKPHHHHHQQWVLNYSLVSLVAGNYSLSRDFISSGIAIVGVRDKYIIITSALNFWQTNFLVYKICIMSFHHKFSRKQIRGWWWWLGCCDVKEEMWGPKS
jgi:hypothetical protein